MPISIRARVVYPVDRPPMDGGVVTIEGERIVAVETAAQASGPSRDLGDVALLPGFVNAHTHLEFSHLREPLGRPGMPLIEWLPLAIAERQNRSHSAAESISAGIAEGRRVGTCAIGEIATAHPAAFDETASIELLMFLEVIGFSQARMASALMAVEERYRVAADNREYRSIGLSPHAPYTVSPSLLRLLVLMAQRLGLPVAMHLAESEEELELLATGSGPFQQLLESRSMWDATAILPGVRPIHYLRWLADAPRALVIHGNFLCIDEHEYLAEHSDRMTVVYCPRTHAYFAHPPYPLAEMLAAGVRVALGTDSRASNPDLSILEEMRYVAHSHSGVSAETILRLGTLAAAEALGCDDDCGSITSGKLANLVAVPLNSNTLAAIFADSRGPSAIWLRGQEV